MPSPDDHREIRRGPLEHFADRLVAGMSDAIVYADAEGVIRFWNRGATRVFGFTETEALGRSLDFIIPEGLRERHWHGYRATMRTGQSRYGGGEILSVPALRKDGARVSVEFTIVPFTDDAGQMTGIAAILRDVTARFEELRALRKELAARSDRREGSL
jgi:PAS domain S-box-containing protein